MDMKFRDKNQAVFLGIRVGFIFLITVIIIIFAAYYTLSQNFQTLLANYTIKLVQAMVAQGVDRVESELAIGRKEAAMSAAFFDTAGTPIPFFPGPYTVRMVYVTQTQTIASDGRKQVINDRPDIRAAFGGKIAVYGPYFNERHEFVICYSAPVIRNGKIRGALSIEKNGYTFCRLIESIRFINTGESYIINAEGTDIAVSDPRHMEWVTSQYNAKKNTQRARGCGNAFHSGTGAKRP